jgi:predicted GIY-YIG superfamily endonuclease
LYKIYLIYSNTEGIVQWKVGITTDLEKRLQILKVGNPNIVGVDAYYEIDNREIAYKVETLVKKQLKSHKVKGEWFAHESLNSQIFKHLCEKCEVNANIWKQIQDNINNDKNNIYR